MAGRSALYRGGPIIQALFPLLPQTLVGIGQGRSISRSR